MSRNLLQFIQSQVSIEPLLQRLENEKLMELYMAPGFVPFLLVPLSLGRTVCYIAKDELEAEAVFESLRSMTEQVYLLPEIDVIPFTHVYPSQDKMSDRMRCINALSQGNEPIIMITTMDTYLRRLPPRRAYLASILNLKKGDLLDSEELSHRLTAMSYQREFKVTGQGQFSLRGDILDIFPPHYAHAVRINLFGDEIETIKFFNPLSQKSLNELDNIDIIPASEFSMIPDLPMEEEASSQALLHSTFPHYYKDTETILDYSSHEVLVVSNEKEEEWAAGIWDKYEKYCPEQETPEIILNHLEELAPDRKVILTGLRESDSLDLGVKHPPSTDGNFTGFVTHLETVLADASSKVFLFLEYEELALRIEKILSRFEPLLINILDEYTGKGRLFIVLSNLEKGFMIERAGQEKLYFYSESDLSGKKRLFRKRIRQIDSLFEDIQDVKEGEYVVHLNYGIGQFAGIQRINVLGNAKDYILILYDENEKLFVPLEQAHLIGKYIGFGGRKPQRDALGGKSWSKKRARVEQSIHEFAQKLVAIYARRSEQKGHQFQPDTVWQKDFEDQFPYIETPDQIRVIEEIKQDMENTRPMERLLCGDVGFGKTEVAMRAAFKAVMDGMQVAVIAPTTVLVEQHWLSFEERFKGFPVKIAMVSRFTPAPKLTQIIKKLKNHELDIIIGTHKLFSEKIQYHKLGLVVVDEEHKFGVLHKEALKERYPLVDFLSLSATPIPRTLNMALSKLRDISLLQTPPDMRIPVETYVSDFNWDVVKYAMERELERGGQVFFVHNTIKRLEEYAYAIEQMVPKAQCAIGHGQMHEEELEEAFIGFVKGRYNVFVCTTIIDSGLDIPNANTIIISDSNRFGLSQLYQLKGRVGRSQREGHAYFLYNRDKVLTENAQKRLFVINEYTDLGAGFNIAMKDLEIRGAGNILGAEQHGNIMSVGYDMYMRMLKEEVERLQGHHHEEVDTLIDLNYSAFIPDEYIPDAATKMEIYKKIVSVKSEEEIRALTEELDDRFGTIPDAVSTLFEISRLKIKAGQMGISSLVEKGQFIEIAFSRYSRVDPIKVMNVKSIGKHPISIKPQLKEMIFYKKFDSSIGIKVKRLTAFLCDIEDNN